MPLFRCSLCGFISNNKAVLLYCISIIILIIIIVKRTFATTIKITGDFHMNGSHHVPTTNSAPFVVSKDEWDANKSTGKCMKNALHVQRYGKRHLSGCSDMKQWKNQAHSLSLCWVTRVWRHQEGSQSVSQ